MTERVNMRWPTGLKARVEDRVGAGLVTKFTVSAVEQALTAEGFAIDAEKCDECGIVMVNGECWTCA